MTGPAPTKNVGVSVNPSVPGVQPLLRLRRKLAHA